MLYNYVIHDQPIGFVEQDVDSDSNKLVVGIQGSNRLGDTSTDYDWIYIERPTCWDFYTNDTNLEICRQ